MGDSRVGNARRAFIHVLLFVACPFAASRPAFADINFQWATVGNPGNAPDPSTGRGSVPYTYLIGQYEVTNGQYVQFLNAVDPTGANTLGLYNSRMTGGLSVAYTGGIDFTSGAPDGAKYTVKPGQDNRPVIWVSWNDAARLVNWISNGQGNAGTETGIYDMSQPAPTRAANARIFIPNEDEWYKAAYHQPAIAGGDADNYWLYPTRSNTPPRSEPPPGAGSSSANYYNDDGVANGYNAGYALTQFNVFNSSQTYLTDVGAYASSGSYYGTFDQGGNVQELTETISFNLRRLRGGHWYYGSLTELSSTQSNLVTGPTNEQDNIGFRLAGIPEPSSAASFAASAGILALRDRRPRRRSARSLRY